MKKVSPVILSVFVLLCCGKAFSQDASMIRHQLVGTWINADDHADKYIFFANGDSRYYFYGSKKPFNYKYSVTNDPSYCDSAFRKQAGDTTAFIRFYDIDEKSTSCYEINGISMKLLSIRPFGQGGYVLYKRKVDKKH
jgi:hypothetical protein